MSSYWRDLEVGLTDEDRRRLREAASENPQTRAQVLTDEPILPDPNAVLQSAHSKNAVIKATLGRRDSFTVSDVADGLDYTQTTVQVRINELRAAGYLERCGRIDGEDQWRVVKGTVEATSIGEVIEDAAGYGSDQYGVGLYGCDDEDCPRHFETYRGMRVHFGHVHRPDPKIECEDDDCGERFYTDQGMRTHHAQVHGVSIAVWQDRDVEREPDGPVECPECGREYQWRSAMKRHVEDVHESEGEHDCPDEDCDYSSDSWNGVKRHYGHAHEGSIAETDRARQLQEARAG